MDFNPYNTSYGKLLKIEKITQMVIDYLIKTDNTNLNYEYKDDEDVKLVFITGCDDLERNIPPFNHPIVTEFRNSILVVTDVRKYISKLTVRPLNLNDVARDKGNLSFCVYRALLVAELAKENYGTQKPNITTACSGFGFFISNVLDVVVRLDPSEKVNIEIAAAYYMAKMFIHPDEVKNGNNEFVTNLISANLNRFKYSLPLQPKVITAVVAELENVPYKDDMEYLIDLLKSQITSGKEAILNKQVLINAISNTWFGHGGSETVLIALENLPTWLALIYTSETNTMFKKSRLSTILNKHANQLGLKDFGKRITNEIKAKEF